MVLLLVTILLQLTLASSEGTIRTEYACEHSSLHLNCSRGLVSILRANYGRLSISMCNPQGNTNMSTHCLLNSTKYILDKMCSNLHSCYVEPGSTLFQDPCPGTSKYLEIQYSCMMSIGDSQHQIEPDFRDSQIQRVWEPGLNQLDEEEIENSLIQNENQTSILSSFEEPKNNVMSMSDKEVSIERSETKSDNSSDILENDNKDKVKSTIPFTEKKTILIVTSSSLLLVVFLSLCYCSIKKKLKLKTSQNQPRMVESHKIQEPGRGMESSTMSYSQDHYQVQEEMSSHNQGNSSDITYLERYSREINNEDFSSLHQCIFPNCCEVVKLMRSTSCVQVCTCLQCIRVHPLQPSHIQTSLPGMCTSDVCNNVYPTHLSHIITSFVEMCTCVQQCNSVHPKQSSHVQTNFVGMCTCVQCNSVHPPHSSHIQTSVGMCTGLQFNSVHSLQSSHAVSRIL